MAVVIDRSVDESAACARANEGVTAAIATMTTRRVYRVRLSMFMNLRSRLVFVGGMPAILLALLACGGEKGSRSSSGDAPASADSMGAAPTDVIATPIRTARNLRESSALAMTRDHPDLLLTINDSGNEPILFVIDMTGGDRGAWRVRNAKNVDWEALAIGPCSESGPAHCVYIGDVGDNDAHHPTRTIYRVAEPPAQDSSFSGTTTAEHVTFTYADGPHDVEAMYVAANGDTFLITKRALETSSRRLRPALVFRIPVSAWRGTKDVVAELIDSLSIIPGSAPLRTITDASLSSNGHWVAVRTYSQLFVYIVDAMTGRINTSVAPAVCNLVPLGEAQGEGVTWIAASGRFAFSSEGRSAPLHFANCPLPQ